MRSLFLSLCVLFSTPAFAECVSVSSSWISQLCFSSSRVTATMKGSTYTFCGMSRATFDSWAHSASPGDYYNTNIKGRYKCY